MTRPTAPGEGTVIVRIGTRVCRVVLVEVSRLFNGRCDETSLPFLEAGGTGMWQRAGRFGMLLS